MKNFTHNVIIVHRSLFCQYNIRSVVPLTMFSDISAIVVTFSNIGLIQYC